MKPGPVDNYRVCDQEIEQWFDWLDLYRMVNQFHKVDVDKPGWEKGERRLEFAGELLQHLPNYKYITFNQCMTVIVKKYCLQSVVQTPLKIN